MPFTRPAEFDASSFSHFKRSLMHNGGLRLSDVIDNKLLSEAIERHGVSSGAVEDAVYTPVVTLWTLVSQVFFAASGRCWLPVASL